MTTSQRETSSRPSIAIALPPGNGDLVGAALIEAGFEAFNLKSPTSVAEAFGPRVSSVLAVLDVGDDPTGVVAAVREARRGRPSGLQVLYIADDVQLDALEAAGMGDSDEIVLQPWSVDGLRWRVEAMAIRAQVPTSSSADALFAGGHVDAAWAPGAAVFAVFNPKGGVGKTTIATNLAAVLQLRKSCEVLLLDADTVTGHVGLSLGLPTGRSVADSWVDEDAGYPHEGILDLATRHSSGIRVAALTSDPLTQPTMKAERVADAITEARYGVDCIVVDLHPSYSDVNLAVFTIADRIIVPVTPDLPAMRAAIQLRDVATEIGVRDRLAMVVNRANSGVSVADIEETVGLPTVAQIRSAGMHFVWSANAGMTLIDRFPKHAVAGDFDHFADRLLSIQGFAAMPEPPRDAVSILRGLFGRKAASEA
jgi:pilus assembly protein CpaE